mgnify:CR=1 FL=1
MTLSEKSRSAIYQGLSTIIEDQEAVQEMLSQYPARDADELVTKDYLRAELAEFRAEMRGEMAQFRMEIRSELHTELRRMMVWNVTTMIALVGVMIAAVAALT